ncbi:hypothetical protein ACQP3F_31970, partial [Escherichia coli]
PSIGGLSVNLSTYNLSMYFIHSCTYKEKTKIPAFFITFEQSQTAYQKKKMSVTRSYWQARNTGASREKQSFHVDSNDAC